MSDGEFQKRMVAFRLKYGLDAIIPDFIPKMLDEAAKDFPEDSGFGFNEDGTPIYDVFDWKKKWFGERKK